MIVLCSEDQTVAATNERRKKNEYRAVGSKFAKYLSQLHTMHAWLPTYFDQKFMKYDTVYLPLKFECRNSERILYFWFKEKFK